MTCPRSCASPGGAAGRSRRAAGATRSRAMATSRAGSSRTSPGSTPSRSSATGRSRMWAAGRTCSTSTATSSSSTASRCPSGPARPSASAVSCSAAASGGSCAATASPPTACAARRSCSPTAGSCAARTAARPDLFWALRGGGAGYAIVTQLRFATRRPDGPLAFTLTFPWSRAGAALDAWQRSLPAAGRDLSYGRFRALCHPDGSLTASASGHWYGSESALRTLLAPLVAARAGAPDDQPARVRRRGAAGRRRAARRTGRSRRPSSAFPTTSARTSSTGRCPPPRSRRCSRGSRPGRGAAAAATRVACSSTRSAPRSTGRARGATAFVHRTHRFHCAYLSFWGAADPPDRAAACAQWTRDTQAVLRAVRVGRRVSELHRPRARRLGAGLLRREPRPPAGGQAPLRPRQPLRVRAGGVAGHRVAWVRCDQSTSAISAAST